MLYRMMYKINSAMTEIIPEWGNKDNEFNADSDKDAQLKASAIIDDWNRGSKRRYELLLLYRIDQVEKKTLIS